LVSIPFILPSSLPPRRQSRADIEFDLTSDDTAAAGRPPRHGSDEAVPVGPLIYLDVGETPPASMEDVQNGRSASHVNSGGPPHTGTNNSGTPRHDSTNDSAPSSPLGTRRSDATRPSSPVPAAKNNNNNNNNNNDDDDEDPVPRLWRVLETPMVRKLYTLLNMRSPPPGPIYDEGPSVDEWPRDDDLAGAGVDDDHHMEHSIDKRDDVHRGHAHSGGVLMGASPPCVPSDLIHPPRSTFMHNMDIVTSAQDKLFIGKASLIKHCLVHAKFRFDDDVTC
jgi:hypothetical protein